MLPLSSEDRFVVALTAAIEARAPLDAPADWPSPTTLEVAALCNTALKLCVARYEGAALGTTLLLFDSANRQAPGFVHLSSGPAWKALARGFPEGLATCVEAGLLRAFAGLAVPLDEAHRYGRPVTRALVLPGVVGVTISGELLAELRPGEVPTVLEAPRPSLEGLLRGAGLPEDAPLRPAHLRRMLQVARRHHHGATIVVSSGENSSDTPPLAGSVVAWSDLEKALRGEAPCADAEHLADALGWLTAVDGALVVSPTGAVLGFGLRLTSRAALLATPLYSDRLGQAPEPRTENPFTGSRRRSAVDYVSDHPGCFALVLSSDGPLNLVWRRGEATVVQRGLECLL